MLHRYMKNNKKTNCLLKASKAKHQNNTLRISFGMDIPCDYKEVMIFDADNGNTNWKDAELLEMKQIYNLNPFESLGKVNKACSPPGCTKMQVHMIYD